MTTEVEETAEQGNTETESQTEESKATTEESTEDKATAEKPTVPEKYDLKLSDDSNLDASDIERISAYAKEKGLSNDAAQEMVAQEEAAIDSYKDSQMQEVEGIRAKWLEESENDKEIGGEDFKQNVELAKRVIDRFGSDDFKETLKDTGFGNHPEVVRVFVRIGQAMSEDQLILAKSQTTTQKSAADVLYPTTATK